MFLEYAGGSHATTSGDVYSLGIVLLDMLTGKRPTDPMFENELNIVNFVERNFLDAIDSHLLSETNDLFVTGTKEADNHIYQCLSALLQVALSCTRLSPNERMNMKETASKIRAIQTDANARRKF